MSAPISTEAVAPAFPGRPTQSRNPLRRRGVRLALGALLTAALVVAAVLALLGAAGQRQTDDPRSPTSHGAGALGQLLADEGVKVYATDDAADALAEVGSDVTLVIARPDLVSESRARELLTAGAGRVVLLRPNSPGLLRFGVRARGVTATAARISPGCGVSAAVQAGAVEIRDARAFYAPTGPADFSCYAGESGSGYVGVATEAGVPVQLLAGGIGNDTLGQEGNAALAMTVFGSQPRVVWLMAKTEATSTASTEDQRPTLLPSWWQLGVVQTVIGLVVVGIWRGRRLGPILTERLPVKVRAAETVEGHGRLYQRIGARDRAAAALRTASRSRLSRRFGHAEDPGALSDALAGRTGRDPRQIRAILDGPIPETDDALVALARDLDHLEQEARQL